MPSKLKNLVLNEVSLVDRGANQHAHVALFKRDFSTDDRKRLASSGAALPDGSFPIETAGDLENAIHGLGRAKDKAKAKAHIIARARTLGATDKLPAGWTVKKSIIVQKDGAVMFAEAQEADEAGEFAGEMLQGICEAVCALRESVCSIMADDDVANKQTALNETFSQFKTYVQGLAPDDEELEKSLAAGLAVVKAASRGRHIGDGQMTEAEKEAEKKRKEAADAKELEDAKKALIVLKRENAFLKMSDKHRQYMADAEMSNDEKDAFADKTPAERDAHMSANPVEKRLPESIRKQLAQADEDRKIIKALQEKDEISTFAKRAESLGSPAAFGEILRKAYAGDAEAIGKLEEAIKGLNAQVSASKVFDEFGTARGASGSAYDQLVAKAAEVRKALPSLTREQAFSKVYADPVNRDLVKQYKAEKKVNAAA